MRAVLEAGSAFGPYLVEARLPDDGDFAVYAARRREFDQRVKLRLGAATAGINRKLHLLDHHGVERVLDQGVTADGTRFVVAEPTEGEPIDVYSDARCLTTAARVRLLLAVTEAVGYAHQHLQPHGRLTAAHVLVDATGHVKVCGFGGGAGDGSERTALTQDVACLGRLGWGLLGGHGAGSLMSAAIMAQDAVAQSRLAGLREAAVPVLLRALRGDLDAVVAHAAAGQYASVDLLASDLARVLQGRSTSVYQATRWERLRRWVCFQPTTAAALAVLLVSALGATAVLLWQTHALNVQRRAAEQRMAALVMLTGALETRLYAAADTMPHPVPVRRALLRQTRNTLNAATEDLALSPEVAGSVARQYRALAQRSADLGDKDGARADLARAEALLESGRK